MTRDKRAHRALKVHWVIDGKPLCSVPKAQHVSGSHSGVTCLVCRFHLGLHTAKDGRRKPLVAEVPRESA